MAKPLASRRSVSVIAAVMLTLFPQLLHAEGLTLLADFEYFSSTVNSIEKQTGIASDTESSRFSQLYQLDIQRNVYPNVAINLGGYFENEDRYVDLRTIDEPDFSSDSREKTIRPYAEVSLRTPLYRGSLAYRNRDAETSGSFRPTENFIVEEYDAVFNWRPVDFPLLNIHYLRTEAHDDPLTVDATRNLMSLMSKYLYKDFSFDYAYVGQESLDNISGTGNLSNNHNGRVLYSKGFNYNNNRIDVNAGAKVIYNTLEFTGADDSSSIVDTPTANPGSSFYILNDSPPVSNEPFDLTLVDNSNPLTNVNIGRGGGLNPVSAGLGFGVPTEVTTVYIQLSEDFDRYPDLASSSQISAIADSYTWRFYSSDDQVELNWTEQPISSVAYNSIDNRFEIRLGAQINTRRIKVTTVPLTLVAPGEIRYNRFRASISVAGSTGQEPENLDQYYNFGLRWSPSARTTFGYEAYYRDQESKHVLSQRKSLTNSVNFRHTFNPVFQTYGKVFRSDRTRTTQQGVVDETDLTYSLALKGNYLETLSQTLVFTGANRDDPDGTTSQNSVFLRTDSDLYDGWSLNLDLGYSLNTLLNNIDQTVKTLRLGTVVEPNTSVNFSLDYSITWTEDGVQVDSTTQYGTFQAFWAMTNTLSFFFRYNFRDLTGRTNTSTFLREFNFNWSPFPDGDLQFRIGYNESRDFGNREVKSISPVLTWRVGQGIFLDLRYNTGTLESPTESSDIDSYIAKLKIFY